MLGNRYSQHSFAQIPDVKMARSKFDRSFTVKDTYDFDNLTPIFCDEILPGDTAKLNTRTFQRLATQVVPIMDNMYVDFFFFFVPMRLLWDNFQKFMGYQENPDDSTDFIFPQMTFPAGGPEVGSIFDKFGLPTDIAAGYTIKNCLPFRAYNLIWNEWFRDQNMQDSVTVNKDDGPDSPSDYGLKKRGKRHDYFTSCLPWPQKGEAVDFPFGGVLPIESTGTRIQVSTFGAGFTDKYLYGGTTGDSAYPAATSVTSQNYWKFGSDTGLEGDLADIVDPTTINQFRQAMMVQSLLELDARGGTRYTEILMAHFNVFNGDSTLQRPEYIGGGEIRINPHSVPQSSPTSGSNYQANLAAFATASDNGKRIGFTKSFNEHGYVIGLACARADITYQQGVNRMWNRSTKFDLFWPKLQQLGEQAVEMREIFVTGTAADDNVFGYQERNAEYRYKPSEIHGEFRSTFATSLDMWHLAQEFGSDPGLNEVFIEQSTPIERAIANSNAPHLLADYFFEYQHARPMMTYSVPATLGRF